VAGCYECGDELSISLSTELFSEIIEVNWLRRGGKSEEGRGNESNVGTRAK
jgi:hypothetical protein